MASAQVLPNSAASSRREHLEAGKRRLEEFRKKKAAERAKKTAPPSQLHSSDGDPNEKQLSNFESVERLADLDGAGTSIGPWGSLTESSDIVIKNDRSASKFSQKGELDFLSDTNNPVQPYVNHESGIHNGTQVRTLYGTEPEQSVALYPQASLELDSTSSPSSSHMVDEVQSNKDINSSQMSTITSSSSTQLQTESGHMNIPTGSFPLKTSISKHFLEVGENTHDTAELSDHLTSDLVERKLIGSALGFSRGEHAAEQPFEERFNFDFRSSSDHDPPYSLATENNYRRSRPSFLDTLHVPKASSRSPFPHLETDKELFISDSSKSDGMGAVGFWKTSVEMETAGPFSKTKSPNVSENSLTTAGSSHKEVDLLKIGINGSSMEKEDGYYSSKQNEDFAALEQHIEDLTQEKFSLQRAVEAARALADSLAAENSSLTDSYNQQRSVVDQLKSDMESLQEEMKARLVELESIKLEYANVQLESDAADERSKLLASEVISLEEKALKLRSNELKLERQLENSLAEMSSYKKKMSSLEKDSQDLNSTISALQEEKKLLQSKLRKASTSGIPVDVRKDMSKKDTSTSTEDIDAIPGTSNQLMSLLGSDPSGVFVLPEDGKSAVEVTSAYIPPDQMRMIQNINQLISELALEKEELTKALASEFSQTSRLKELNKELSQKLEVQTQRLELLTARSMAGENTVARQPNSSTLRDDTTYADEGDEVVERVLGWIMKLFPGGPSKRRTSKLL